MITLSSVRNVDASTYDNVWYVTTTCPNKKCGCEHHPELAADYATHRALMDAKISIEQFNAEYISKMKSSEVWSKWLEVVKRSEEGEWFQLIFYEDPVTDGEASLLYDLLKDVTSKICID